MPIHAPEFPPSLKWFNCPAPLRLSGLRGRVVLLDFWTSGCINCLHILQDLKRVESRFGEAVVVLGVHSPKFDYEKTDANVQKAVSRYAIRHPVLNDSEMRVWTEYAVKAWPTQVLVDQAGYIVGEYPGEGHLSQITSDIERILDLQTPETRPSFNPTPTTAQDLNRLRFPGKIAVGPDGQLAISDTGNHRIVITDPAGLVLDVIGSGVAGDQDGGFPSCRFESPQGLAFVGEFLFVADSGNHLIRRCSFSQRTMVTVAGTGRQESFRPEWWGIGPARLMDLNSPWDVLAIGPFLFVAMAGSHRIWLMDLNSNQAGPYAGNGYEGLHDGPLDSCRLAQPFGLATDGSHLFVADAESSAVRAVPLDHRRPVTTVVGQGLFQFGDRDGAGADVKLQHPSGLAFHQGQLFLTDTYNHRIKKIDPAERSVLSIAGQGRPGSADGTEASFWEPGGLAVLGQEIYVADAGNHSIRKLYQQDGQVLTITVPISFT